LVQSPRIEDPIGPDVDLWRFTGWRFQERSITLASGAATAGATRMTASDGGRTPAHPGTRGIRL